MLDFGLAKVGNAESEEWKHAEPGPGKCGSVAERDGFGGRDGDVYVAGTGARGAMDARSDLILVWRSADEIATGKTPFPGDTTGVIFDAILNRTPVTPSRLNPQVLPKFEEIIHKALEKDRELRYQSAGELRTDLRRLKRDSESGKTAPMIAAAASAAASGKARNRRMLIYSIVAIAVVLVAAGGAIWWYRASAASRLRQAQVGSSSHFSRTRQCIPRSRRMDACWRSFAGPTRFSGRGRFT